MPQLVSANTLGQYAPVLGLILMALGLAVDVWAQTDLLVCVLYALAIGAGLWVHWRHYPIASGLAAGACVLFAGPVLTGPWRASLARLLAAGGLLVAARFIQLRRDAELHAQRRTQELADITRALDHAAIVARTDVDGRITYVNDKFCEISGYSRAELLGADHRIINSGLHPPEFFRDLWRTIARGQIWQGEIRNRTKDGRFYWVDTTIVPFLSETGQPRQYIAIRADITARKAAEERLVQQAALAQVGQMAAVVAHEVRNPLAGIKGTMQVLMGRRQPGDDELGILREVVSRVDALSGLIDDLMTFARPRPPLFVEVDLSGLVREAVDFLQHDLAWQHIEVQTTTAPTVAAVDPELMRSTLSNLLINAAQALNGRGRIWVTLASEANNASIEVRDSGPGIPAEIRDRVLDPFFTTKSRGGGLGLPIAKRTAELHRGALTLFCPPEGGTVVRVTLPMGAAPALAGPPPPTARAQAQSRPESART